MKFKKVDLNGVNDVSDRHVAALVIGHPDQRNTGINHRFLQGLLVKRPMMIDYYQDETDHLCRDPYLREVLFFADAADYRDKLAFVRIEKNFDEVNRRLAIEAERVRNEPAENFIRRVRGEQ